MSNLPKQFAYQVQAIAQEFYTNPHDRRYLMKILLPKAWKNENFTTVFGAPIVYETVNTMEVKAWSPGYNLRGLYANSVEIHTVLPAPGFVNGL